MATTHADPAEAIRLLDGIQRLLRDSSFTTDYKLAVLHAICDLAQELEPGADELSLNGISERVIELYWHQSPEFTTPGSSTPLRLRHSSDAKDPIIVKHVQECSRTFHGHLRAARIAGQFPELAAEVLDTLERYPLELLQREGGAILYQWPAAGDTLRLLPGVAAVLRRFYDLLIDMIQVRWTLFIERRTDGLEGNGRLRDHLFGTSREELRCVVEPMLRLQDHRCFYLPTVTLTASSAVVDHFLPWSRTRDNSVGNLVLTTKPFNTKKSDDLRPEFRDRWDKRNLDSAEALQKIARDNGLLWHPQALSNRARSLFGQAG